MNCFLEDKDALVRHVMNVIGNTKNMRGNKKDKKKEVIVRLV